MADTPAKSMTESNLSNPQTAAFFRVEGTLLKRTPAATAAWFSANAKGGRERVFRLGHAAVAAAGFGLLRQNDRALANRLAWAALRGMSEDRLAVLAEEYVDEHVIPNILDSGLELVSRARREGHRIVLISESLDLIAQPLAEHVRRVDDIICNTLELRDGETTGRLNDPVIGGHELGTWVTAYADEHKIDLSGSVAYGCHGPDLLLLSSVGNPCAVNADFTLRRAATAASWPLLDYAA